MPFAVAGMGDLLALFRCISCRFAFGTDVSKPATLGAPGRVYTSSEVGRDTLVAWGTQGRRGTQRGQSWCHTLA